MGFSAALWNCFPATFINLTVRFARQRGDSHAVCDRGKLWNHDRIDPPDHHRLGQTDGKKVVSDNERGKVSLELKHESHRL